MTKNSEKKGKNWKNGVKLWHKKIMSNENAEMWKCGKVENHTRKTLLKWLWLWKWKWKCIITLIAFCWISCYFCSLLFPILANAIQIESLFPGRRQQLFRHQFQTIFFLAFLPTSCETVLLPTVLEWRYFCCCYCFKKNLCMRVGLYVGNKM